MERNLEILVVERKSLNLFRSNFLLKYHFANNLHSIVYELRALDFLKSNNKILCWIIFVYFRRNFFGEQRNNYPYFRRIFSRHTFVKI